MWVGKIAARESLSQSVLTNLSEFFESFGDGDSHSGVVGVAPRR